MRKAYYIILLIITGVVVTVSCARLEPKLPQDDKVLDGPLEGLSFEQQSRFLAGDNAFKEVFTSQTGLGPIFVASSCASCHAGDGKGHPFTTLTRYGQSDTTGNQFMHMGGPQLQNRALPGFLPEYLPGGATFSKFTPPANTGLGFLELVPDELILSMADPLDADGDGISGVPNWIALPSFISPRPGAVEQNGKYIHRFGKKAAAYNLLHQTVNAYHQDMGITSTYIPRDIYSGLESDPEVTNQTVNNLVFYLQTLKAPIQRTPDNPEVVEGKNLFIRAGCESCHKQTLVTGYSPVAQLSNVAFHPYTDLLLHDMGSELDDHYTEGNAKSSEWRTPPLWGLGLSSNSQGGQYFLLHDGRARSIESAIQSHGGEALPSRNAFNQMSTQERNAVLQFLKSL